MKHPVLFTVFLFLTCFSAFSQNANPSVGSIRHLQQVHSKYVAPRNVDIWLPGDYSESRKYAVLYMHDGQMLFDSTITWDKQEWGVDETLGDLLARKKIRDCIVVGIWNTGENRHSEYFPQKALNYLTPAEKTDLLNNTYGNENKRLLPLGLVSDNYLKFIVQELKPMIDSLFPTMKDRGNTFIAGSSMGGLISLYAICEYPGIFGGAACLSTHWPGSYKEKDNPVPAAMLAYMKAHLPSPKNHRIYFDYGSGTLDALYKPYQQEADKIMKSSGFSSKNWITREFPGENHSENAWRKRFWMPALFLMGE